ncbi:hypothetical protein ACFW2X_02195 [Streptomyces antibioticus]|uniref:hypothetical protein n=1 Tax=Streptomyces antibioticus TaxID=1890 RepID=UPI0036D1D1DF
MAAPDPTAVLAAAADARTALAALVTAADAYALAAGSGGPTTPQVIASVVLDVVEQAQHTVPDDITVLRPMQYARKNVVRLAHPVVTA